MGFFKRIIEALKDFVADVNIETSPPEISIQTIDLSCRALVWLNLNAEEFEPFTFPFLTLGVKMSNLSKVMKFVEDEDTITLSAEEEPTKLKIEFHNKKKEKRESLI